MFSLCYDFLIWFFFLINKSAISSLLDCEMHEMKWNSDKDPRRKSVAWWLSSYSSRVVQWHSEPSTAAIVPAKALF